MSKPASSVVGGLFAFMEGEKMEKEILDEIVLALVNENGEQDKRIKCLENLIELITGEVIKQRNSMKQVAQK